MESPASFHSSSRERSTQTVPLMDVVMEGCGVPRRTTMIKRKSGGSVKVGVNHECHSTVAWLVKSLTELNFINDFFILSTIKCNLTNS